MELVGAQVKRELATALEREAKANSESTGIGVEVFNTLIKALSEGKKATTNEVKALVDAGKADAAHLAASRQTGGQT